MDVLAKGVAAAKPYLMGEQFTAADVIIGSGLRWGMMFKMLPERPEFAAYVARLKPRYPREQIMKDYGVILPYANAATGKEKDKEDPAEIFGYQLPPKTLVLSFDDGPHGTYTDDIAAILIEPVTGHGFIEMHGRDVIPATGRTFDAERVRRLRLADQR